MRTQFLQALTRPFEDIEIAGQRLQRFREPIVVMRAIEAKAAKVERALETASLGLALAEIVVRAVEEDEEP
jgi:hypothetical protein